METQKGFWAGNSDSLVGGVCVLREVLLAASAYSFQDLNAPCRRARLPHAEQQLK